MANSLTHDLCCFIKIRIIYFAVKFEHLCLWSVKLDFVFITPPYVHVYSGCVARSCSHSSLGFLMRDLNHFQSNLHGAHWMGGRGCGGVQLMLVPHSSAKEMYSSSFFLISKVSTVKCLLMFSAVCQLTTSSCSSFYFLLVVTVGQVPGHLFVVCLM